MKRIQDEALLMGSESAAVSFLEYTQALARQRRRAALRRAEMVGGWAWEMPHKDEQEGRDREILSFWEDTHGQAGFVF